MFKFVVRSAVLVGAPLAYTCTQGMLVPRIGNPCHQKYLHVPDQADKSGNGSERVTGMAKLVVRSAVFGGCTLGGTPAPQGVPHIGNPCHQRYLHVPDQAD